MRLVTLLLDRGLQLAGVVNNLVNRFAWGTSRRENFVYCLLIVLIFVRVGGTYNLGEILKSSNGGVSHKVLGPFFMGRVIPQNTK